jgi:glycine oxidase
MAENGEILVIGGGAIGLLTARELASNGATVTVLERGETGRESSWAGGGILSPLHPWRYPHAVTALAGWGQARYREVCTELREATGIDPEWAGNGLLVLDSDERQAALAWAAAEGVELEEIDAERLYRLEPALVAGFDQALWLPGAGQVRNPRLLKALRADLERRGVALREHTEVLGLSIQGRRVTGVETSTGPLHAERVVVAGGAWSAGLLAELGARVEVKPVRGQMILYRTEPGSVQRITLQGDHYLIPRRDGRVLAGSTVEDTGFDKSTTAEALEKLQRDATALIPALAQCTIEHHWAGLRPGSRGGVPYIGEHPHVDGLYVNTGHFRNGVVLGLASARLLADLLLGHSPILAPGAYGVTAERPEAIL